ncbi:hypothetical protein SAMN04487770_12646 [Butyrivibrio sp. ob235]|uniref:hypothetical protein n=1 Tax=Butyrivibrio sp. ob235 TaxID=1761780 RepID=UPI0008B7FC1D|nr:hypothetical protein [Butyrivibrio sp. ob235]SEM12074.1 hypothetical protein SAMN04487770_12646 [Butyrivibrio sp. ob235]
MSEYYEPQINISSPETHNTMGVIVVLKEKVDGEILRQVVEELRERFPYFYVKVGRRGGGQTTEENRAGGQPTEASKNGLTTEPADLIPIPNDLPMTTRNTWEPIKLNSAESNYHLAAWKYENKRLAFEIDHALTDGAGIMPYIKSAMYLYLSKATGKTFNSEGFRLPGDTIPESETGDPFKDIDFTEVEEPFYQKKPITDFLRLVNEQDYEKRVFYLKLPEEQIMQYCRDKDGSPNVFFSVMLAKAARRYKTNDEKPVTVSICTDRKAILGNHDNYRMFAGDCRLDFPKNRDLTDITKACTIARGQVMLQIQPENALYEIKQMKQMQQTPPAPDISLASICVSYVTGRSFGPLDPYIEEIYVVTALSKITDILCEITCINHSFFIALMQPFSSEEYYNCFLKELDEAGIHYEELSSEPLRICGI